MPCKHEDGAEACLRNTSGKCVVSQRISSNRWYREHPECVPKMRRYRQNTQRRTAAAPTETMNRGCAGEHLVLCELLARQLSVGTPTNPQTEHDMFVRLGQWRTIQVKLGALNTKTGTIYLAGGRSRITSDLIAVVDLEGKRIRWISNTDEPVPKELL